MVNNYICIKLINNVFIGFLEYGVITECLSTYASEH
jgi:hypothetical protein